MLDHYLTKEIRRKDVMYHVEGVKESIHLIDPFNSLNHSLIEYQERKKYVKCKCYRAANVGLTSDLLVVKA